MNTSMKIAIFGLLFFLIICSGCVPMSEQFVGNRIAAAPTATLVADGSGADSWKTFDVVIDYQYVRNGDLFEVSGSARLSDFYPIMYNQLIDLKVYLFLVNDRGRVLAPSLIARSLNVDINQQLQFKLSLRLPPGTSQISFGYDGRVTAEEGNHSFYLLPLGR